MEERIRKAVSAALATMGAGDVSFVVERPADLKHGDYTVNAALVAAKALKKNPRELADEFSRLVALALGKEAHHVGVAGPGFVNITLAREAVTFAVAEADAKKEEWGKGNLGGKVMIEYTSPNLFKPLHIGNLVGNILGESIARLLEGSGARVTRINYPSDIGLTVAKGVWGLKTHSLNPKDIAQLGQAYVLGNTAYEEGTEDQKKEIEEVNRTLYAGTDEGLNTLRETGIRTSRCHLDEICRALGTTFDQVFFESQSAPLGKELVQAHIDDGVFEKSDGAVVYHGEKKGLHTRVFINSQGLPTYEAKDIGLFDLKSTANAEFTRSITVTGSEQKEYFKVIFAAIAEVFPGRVAGKELSHISNGFLRLTTGKMSSRKGNVITGESLLEDLKAQVVAIMSERLVDGMREVAEQVAIGAIKYMVLRQAPGSDIIFDAEKSLSLEGDSGPYLQYALVRAKSVLAKSTGNTEEKPASAEPTRLERIILHFPEVTARAASELAPNLLVNYLTELAGEWNSFYAQERIIGAPDETHKLLIARAFVQTMTNGLTLLGIPTPGRM